MPSNNSNSFNHMHKQIKAVYEYIKPEYRNTFNRLCSLFELGQIINELNTPNEPNFTASETSQNSKLNNNFDLSAFIKAVSPVCSKQECAFLKNIMQTKQTFYLLEQMQQIENSKENFSPQDIIFQFLTPEQRQQFNEWSKSDIDDDDED